MRQSRAMAPEPIRLLLAEDSAVDVEMELREIRRAGLRIEHRIADSEDAFTRELRAFAPHVILSDFSMPSFDGMEALRIAHELAPWTPFLFVSGTLGEDYAIRALKNGATDYVLKTNLVRLPAAIERALAGAKERRARKSAEAGLSRAQAMAKLAHVVTGADGAFENWSESLPRLVGIERDRFPRSMRQWFELVHPEDRERFRAMSLAAGAGRKGFDIDYRLRRDEGEWMHIRQVVEPVTVEAGAQEDKWFST